MTIELRILSGSRAGARERFEQAVVSVGRHPDSSLRFDPQRDLDVSARHAELRDVDGQWIVYDRQSTNGTFVNGERVSATRRLRPGDIVSFGAFGPRIEVLLPDRARITPPASPAQERVPPPARRDTGVRVAEAVREQTTSLRWRYRLALAALLAAGVVSAVLWQRRTSAREGELLALLARSDSASAPLQRTIAAMKLRDSMFAARLSQLDAASGRRLAEGREIASGRSAASPESVALLSERVAADTRIRTSLTRMDFARVHDLNDDAVAMVASDLDGTFVAATAFSVAPSGLLVTNRHVMRAPSGRAPRRIRVLFANTREWLPARLVRVSERDDLAMIRVEGTGRYPVVAGVRRRTTSDTRVGSPVATIGYPLAVDTPMEGSGLDVRASTTTTAGTVSKRLADLLQIDSYAGQGSSGSPVLDLTGNVVGVVFGGAPASGGRIVYAVPAERLAAFVAGEAGDILR